MLEGDQKLQEAYGFRKMRENILRTVICRHSSITMSKFDTQYQLPVQLTCLKDQLLLKVTNDHAQTFQDVCFGLFSLKFWHILHLIFRSKCNRWDVNYFRESVVKSATDWYLSRQ